jgi:hypothetical protein
MKRLVFFSNSYPYSQTENWSARELGVLCKYFDDIVVAGSTASCSRSWLGATSP